MDVPRKNSSRTQGVQPEIVQHDIGIVEEVKLMEAQVRQRFELWPEELVRLAVMVLRVYRLRTIDMSLREHVLILYLVEGQDRLRAHMGVIIQLLQWRPGRVRGCHGPGSVQAGDSVREAC